jgi:Uncharacterized conserved protein
MIYTVARSAEDRLIIKKSVFIAKIKRIDNLETGAAFLAELKKEYSGATHTPYAMIAEPENFRFSDDGEPSGTSGRPILSALQKAGLSFVVAAVIRYFGGIKLGANGLLSAYTKAVSECAGKAGKMKIIYSSIISATLGYSEYKNFINRIKDTEILITDTRYGESVDITFAAPEESADKISGVLGEMTAGRERGKLIENKYIAYEVNDESNSYEAKKG